MMCLVCGRGVLVPAAVVAHMTAVNRATVLTYLCPPCRNWLGVDRPGEAAEAYNWFRYSPGWVDVCGRMREAHNDTTARLVAADFADDHGQPELAAALRRPNPFPDPTPAADPGPLILPL